MTSGENYSLKDISVLQKIRKLFFRTDVPNNIQKENFLIYPFLLVFENTSYSQITLGFHTVKPKKYNSPRSFCPISIPFSSS
jgi:hypothetical protein